MISSRLKSALKLSLAMIIAYGIALWMDWDRPYWAGLAIANCSLTSFGESVNKGVLRLGGTMLAVVVALTLISVFPQERWLFIGALGAWVAFCSYMMIGTSRFYFWQVAGFVVPILAVNGGADPVSDFGTVVLRSQQTVLGVLCFSLVYALLWPVSSRKSFEDTVYECISLQRRIISYSLKRLAGDVDLEDPSTLRLQVAQRYSRLKSLLDAAMLDSFDVWDRRAEWRRVIAHLSSIDLELQRLRLGLGDYKYGRQSAATKALGDALIEKDARLDDVMKLLSGGEPRSGSDRTADIAFNQEPPHDLSHFEHAALSVAAYHTRQGLDIAEILKAEIANLRDRPVESLGIGWKSQDAELPRRRVLDLDTWIFVLRGQVVFLLAIMCIFYLPGFPSAPLLVSLSVAITMVLLMMPQASVRGIVLPLVMAIGFFGFLHIMIMPAFTGFGQLAAMLFVTTFLIAYFTARPEQRLARIIGLDVMVVCLQIDNQQQYSFLFLTIAVVGVLAILAIIEMTRYFPISLRPEHRTEALIRRFFASADHLIRNSPGLGQHDPAWLGRWRLRYHRAEIQTIPRKLVPWLSAIPEDARRTLGQGDATYIAASLEELSNRILDFVEARHLPQAAPLLAGGGEAMRRWRLGVADVTRRLLRDPGSAETTELEARLSNGIVDVEKKVEEVLNAVPAEELKPQDFKNMYHVLGAYRGLAEGVVDYSRRATAIDWRRLRESRF